MKRPSIKNMLSFTFVAMAVGMLIFWSEISEAFGPMKQNELQCLICHRERVQKWVCGSKVRDEVVENEHSDWIDSFTPKDHEHVWIGHTSYNRLRWFGRTSIGCGGIATIPRIFEQRSNLGEPESQQLVAKFHQLVKGQSPQIDFDELDRFTKAVREDPHSLLRPDDPN